MFDFIKKLFKKPTKVSVKKRNCAECKAKKQVEIRKIESNVNVEKRDPEPVLVNDIRIAAEMPVEVENEETTSAESPSDNSEEHENVEALESIEPAAQYVIKLSGKEAYRFELVSAEGKMIIKSGEYTLKRSCVSGIQSVKKNGATENIDDRTAETLTKVANPKYEIAMDEKGKYRFSLKAPNGYLILTSNAYSSKRSCIKAIEAVRSNSQTDDINDTTK